MRPSPASGRLRIIWSRSERRSAKRKRRNGSMWSAPKTPPQSSRSSLPRSQQSPTQNLRHKILFPVKRYLRSTAGPSLWIAWIPRTALSTFRTSPLSKRSAFPSSARNRSPLFGKLWSRRTQLRWPRRSRRRTSRLRRLPRRKRKSRTRLPIRWTRTAATTASPMTISERAHRWSVFSAIWTRSVP